MGRRVLLLKLANPFEELLGPSLLEKTHQRGAESLAGIRGHLGHGRLGAFALLDIAAGDLLELQVSRHVGGNQDVCQLAVGHQELRDQVNVPVIDPSVFLPRLLAGADVAVLLEQLQDGSAEEHSRRTGGRTVSMLTDAASLEPLSAISGPDVGVGSSTGYIPSVVVIAIDMEDLVTLHAQDTGREKDHQKQITDCTGPESYLP